MENRRLMGPAMRKCGYCETPFPVSRLNKKYCNDLCRSRAFRLGVTEFTKPQDKPNPRPYIV